VVKEILATNLFLRSIEAGRLQKIEYKDLEGRALKAWVIEPFAYVKGRRYPVVIWAYPGQTYGQYYPRSGLAHLNSSHPLNLQLLAAHGYVVLLPSMPLEPYGERKDPYAQLTKGVLSAMDKLVEVGIADPDRFAVMGQSYGGYSTYALITQTNRFKAAVALAGFCDLLSTYGTFESELRYQSSVHEDPFRMWNMETLGMTAPPWKEMERYIGNSPITYVGKVETPLLIMQGDLDYIPIQQGEEFFTALYRQNKKARFVRYWGEDHLLTSPANIRDMWARVYVWLDTFLGLGVTTR
jgi:dipeptidyl aminopeptidase/acylaminoacyl peptidase